MTPQIHRVLEAARAIVVRVKEARRRSQIFELSPLHADLADELISAIDALPDIAQGDVVEVPRALLQRAVERCVKLETILPGPGDDLAYQLRAILSDPAKGVGDET